MSVHDEIAAQQARERVQRQHRFLEVLRTSTEEDRRAGVVEAAARGDLDLTEIVPLALADRSPVVRAAGARAAGAGSLAAVDGTLLRLASDDDDTDVRLEAIVALERLGHEYPGLVADLPERARRRLPELRRIARRPFGITWRRTWTFVLGAVLSAAVLHGLRAVTGGRSDDVLLVLGLAFVALGIGSAVCRELRRDRRAA